MHLSACIAWRKASVAVRVIKAYLCAKTHAFALAKATEGLAEIRALLPAEEQFGRVRRRNFRDMTGTAMLTIYPPLAKALHQGQLRHVRNLRRINRERENTPALTYEQTRQQFEKRLNRPLTERELKMLQPPTQTGSESAPSPKD